MTHEPKTASICSTSAIASMPWVFTQRHPLDTSEFIREAKRRGFDLDLSTLRELYRHELLPPFLAIRRRPVSPPAVAASEPSRAGSRLGQLRHARDTGRLQDLATVPYMPRLPFERQGQAASYGWWNGLIYSQYQLLALISLRGFLGKAKRRLVKQGETYKVTVKLPTPDEHLVNEMDRFRRIARVATALEARYLPTLDPEWIRLSNADPEDWKKYQSDFDPVAISNTLGYTAEQALRDAEHILFLAHTIDPVGRSWSQLIRRAPRDSWKELKDAALSAMDLREVAEILLCFFEDLAGQGLAEPLPEIDPRMGWHPVQERLSGRQGTLDQNLMDLGISPHPRVVLAVEGESEEVHTPKIWDALGYPDAPELMRILKLGGVDRDLEKVAALASAPLVGRKDPNGDYWELIKPPARLMVAVDPEGKYFAPDKVDKTRRQIINEIKSVLKAQGARTTDSQLEQLVEIRTWSQSCYELAHFTNEELADAMMAVHHTVNGLTRDELTASIGETRDRGHKDIKEVWGRWDRAVSKVDLAHALWPAMERRIQKAKLDESVPVPEIVQVVQHAYLTAQRWRYPTFVLVADS